MRVVDSPSDLALAVKRNAAPEDVFYAVQRLRLSKMADVRVIAAQACVGNDVVRPGWLTQWICSEPISEVRGWLYVALAVKSPTAAKRVLGKIRKLESHRMKSNELIYLICGLAISFKSRIYLLDLLRFFYDKNSNIASEAFRLSKMLIDNNDKITLRFVTILKEEANTNRSRS